MKKSTRTISGAVLDTARRFGEPLPIMPNSTLNEKFSVFDGEKPRPGEYPITQYLAIGIKGVVINVETDGTHTTTYRSYQPSWASLLGHVPFIMRPIDNDLTPTERSKYRMRVVDEFNGVTYACYYLLRFDPMSFNPVAAEQRKVVNGEPIPSEWSHSPEALNPTPLTVYANQRLRTGNDYLSAIKKLEFWFSPNDVQEILNVVNIIYGDPNKANITEFALVSGIDRSVSGLINGVQTNYVEAVYAQITDFVNSTLSAPNALRGQTLFIDAGSNEPMLIVE